MTAEKEIRIWVAEDEPAIRELILLHLNREGYTTETAADGEMAIQKLGQNSFDLLIVDWMLPKTSGVEITRWLRSQKQFRSTNVLFVTARSSPEDLITALELGADDYLVKPFDVMVLISRVRALLRRRVWLKSEEAGTSDILKLDELTLNRLALEVHVGDEKVDLTRSEFQLLQILMENQGKVLSRSDIISQIHGENFNVVGRTVDTHIFTIRKKLGRYSEVLETVRGVGYRIRYLK